MSVIAAISTPQAVGGISVIRLSGDGCFDVADKCFTSVSGKKLVDMKGYTASYGYISDGENKLDDCVALVFRSPHSYTGEDAVEISCHGGIYVTRRVLRCLLDAGAIPAEAGEFTKRAFLNGKIDLAEAENIMNIISASGESALKSASRIADGELSRVIKEQTERVINMCAALTYWSDDPEEDVELADPDKLASEIGQTADVLEKLVKSYDNGKAFANGLDTVICGRTNVGKSTLMNILTGAQSSIVTDIEGTTRDVVEQTVRAGDVILRLADTAGIRQTDDSVESIGIEKANRRIDTSEMIIAVFDASNQLQNDDMQILEKCKGRMCVAVMNKSDLGVVADENTIRQYVDNVVKISASKGDGVDELISAIETIASKGETAGSLTLTGERQRRCCAMASDVLRQAQTDVASGVTLDAVNVLLQSAAQYLDELTGRNVTDAIIDEVFSKFCVGK